jgi:hypothetical protein
MRKRPEFVNVSDNHSADDLSQNQQCYPLEGCPPNPCGPNVCCPNFGVGLNKADEEQEIDLGFLQGFVRNL